MDEKLWELYAYGARYGMQPISELRALTLDELCKFVSGISAIVEKESPKRDE